jgi:DNA helicase HerA-like ATPase
VLAVGFILAPRIAACRPCPVPNPIRHIAIVDEVHRVATFKAVDTMIRDGHSKGLAVVIATRQPGDLLDVVATNAQTEIFFRLSDATVASVAPRGLDPTHLGPSEQVCTVGVGGALVRLGDDSAQPLAVVQACRDANRLGLSAEGDG